jgi:GNAT superfamily N-acetyltransferase
MPRKSSRERIRPYQEADQDALVALWERCGLVTRWNEPVGDIALAGASANTEILIAGGTSRLDGAVMTGHDGHRGWLYYLAVDPDRRLKGLGTALVRAAEAWLQERGIPKVQILIRETNLEVADFYARLGYHPNPCTIMQRWLTDRGAPRIAGREDGKLDCVITYLEMTEPPALPRVHPPRNANVALLRALEPTVAFYRFLYDRVGEPWLWWERRILDDASLAAAIHDKGVEIYVLYVDGAPAGYAELDRRAARDIDLAYFGLMPEYLGRGLGPFLLYSAIDIAWGYEPERLLVNTNTLDHATALPLYQRMGFRPYRREEKVITDPRLNGIIPAVPTG